MKAIILIAGKGTRLKPITNTIPKCLIKVNGKEILLNVLSILDKNRFEEVICVVGYLGNKVRQKIKHLSTNMKISLIENASYEETNSSFSLWLALKDLNIDDTLLVLEGDIIFENDLVVNLINNSHDTAVALQKCNLRQPHSFIVVDSRGLVINWIIHKGKMVVDSNYNDRFKRVGIFKFGREFIRVFLMPILREHIKRYGGTEPLDNVIHDLIVNKNAKIGLFEVENLKWFEIDDIDDLINARKLFKNVKLN